MHAERLKRLYTAMLKCRELDEGSRMEARGYASGRGLEAIISGVAIHLRQEDLVAPSAYEYLVRSVQCAPRQPSASNSTRAGSENGPTGSGSNQLCLAAGMALACKLMGKPGVTLCLSNMENGADFWRDAVSFASQGKLPVVFVVAHSPGESQNAFGDLRNQVQELLPAIAVDGTDVVAVYRVAEESTRRARQGLGPSLMECRLEPGRDPLLFMESYLKARSLWSDGWKQELTQNSARHLRPAQKSNRKAV